MLLNFPKTRQKAEKMRPSLWTTFLVLLGTMSNVRTTDAINIQENDSNKKFFPDGARDTKLCDIPPYQGPAFEATDSMCTTLSTPLTLDDAKKLVVEYAPYLFFHPLEKYALQSVNATFDDPINGKIWNLKDKKSPFSDTLDQKKMLDTIRDRKLTMHSSSYFFVHDLETPEDYKNGAAFDEPVGKARHSQAHIYYNIFEKENTWIFNYYFYHTWNGIANMVSLSSYKGVQSYTSFQLSPFGVHEGDWEGMSVRVCKSETVSQPLAVTYQQHGWQQTTDCTKGECTFFKDTHHPVGFSALNSHATYPVSTENMVYTNVEVPFFTNLQGVLVSDRTAYLQEDGTYRVFVPKDSNLEPIDNPETVDYSSPSEKYWQAFGGFWGNSTKPKMLPELGICLNEEQTKSIPCPDDKEDPIFGLVMQLLGVYPPTSDLITQAAHQIGKLVVPLFSETGQGPTGPTMKEHWNKWQDPTNCPLYDVEPPNTTAAEYCNRLTDIPDTGRTAVDSDTLDVMGHLVGIIVMCFGLVAITVLILWCNKRGKAVLLEFDEDTGEVQKPGRHIWTQLHAPSLVFSFWFFVVIIGALMFAISLSDLMDLLERYVTGIDWDAIGTFLIALGVIILVIDIIICVLIWLPSQAVWNKLMQVYHHYKGEEEAVEIYKKNCCNIPFKTLNTLFLVGFALLFISLMLAAVVVVVGVAVVGFSAAFNEICSTTIGSLDGICLNLPWLDHVTCGADFQEFCNLWADDSRMVTLWGAILISIGHFYLVGAAGASWHQQSFIMPMISLLPRRKDYLQRIDDMNNVDPHVSQKTDQSVFMEDLKA